MKCYLLRVPGSRWTCHSKFDHCQSGEIGSSSFDFHSVAAAAAAAAAAVAAAVAAVAAAAAAAAAAAVAAVAAAAVAAVIAGLILSRISCKETHTNVH